MSERRLLSLIASERRRARPNATEVPVSAVVQVRGGGRP